MTENTDEETTEKEEATETEMNHTMMAMITKSPQGEEEGMMIKTTTNIDMIREDGGHIALVMKMRIEPKTETKQKIEEKPAMKKRKKEMKRTMKEREKQEQKRVNLKIQRKRKITHC